MEICQLGVKYPMLKVTALKGNLSVSPETVMNILFVLSANFESTVNVVGDANFRKIVIFKFIKVIRYG